MPQQGRKRAFPPSQLRLGPNSLDSSFWVSCSLRGFCTPTPRPNSSRQRPLGCLWLHELNGSAPHSHVQKWPSRQAHTLGARTCTDQSECCPGSSEQVFPCLLRFTCSGSPWSHLLVAFRVDAFHAIPSLSVCNWGWRAEPPSFWKLRVKL